MIGYGSQGHAHAQNLRDSGVAVKAGVHRRLELRDAGEGRRHRDRHDRRGRPVGRRHHDPRCRTRSSGWSSPRTIEPHLTPGKMLMFAHGFNIRFGYIKAPGGRRHRHGRPQGAGSPRAPRVRRGPRRAGARRRGAGRVGQGVGDRAVATRRPSAGSGPPASRRRSPRRPRPTSSASRPSCAAAPPSWFSTDSRC